MARYHRYRKYSRRGKVSWAPNFIRLDNQVFTATSNAISGQVINLVRNNTTNTTGTPNIFTVKNVEVSLDIEAAASALETVEGISYFIMYAPQDINITEDYPIDHPEYIMAYRFYGSPSGEGSGTIGVRNPVRVKTRLARKLNTGDRIILLLNVNNVGTTNAVMSYSGVCKFVTKAN